MQEISNQATPNTSEEVLITREITFRNSTFGALKTFMREHKRRTGQTLSNAAAVDMILRAHLARHIHPVAVTTMAKLTRPHTVQILQAMPRENLEDIPAAPVVPKLRAAPIINVSLVRRRPSATAQDTTGEAA